MFSRPVYLHLPLPALVKRSPNMRKYFCVLSIILPFRRKMTVTFLPWQQRNPPSALAGSDLEVLVASQGPGTSADPVGLAAPVLLAFFFHLEKLLDWGWSRLDNKSGCVEVSDRGSPTVRRKHRSKTPGEVESQFGVWNSPSWVQVSLGLDIFKLCDTFCRMCIKLTPASHH